MKELLFTKGVGGLVPADEKSSEWFRKKKLGATVHVDAAEMRNPWFFRKWWALVNLGYDYWNDSAKTVEFQGVPVKPNFDRFRKDVTISAGFFYPVVNLKGELRIEAESLKFSEMDEETFEKLYSATINVLLERVFNGKVCPTWSEAELRNVAEQIRGFE